MSARATVLPLAALLLLAGCLPGDPEGVSPYADEPAFAQCLDDAGMPPLEDDPSVTEERAWLSRPGVLTCLAEAMDTDDRTEAVLRAFPSGQDFNEEGWVERRDRRRQVLIDYVQTETEVEEAVLVERLAALTLAFEWDTVMSHQLRQQVAFALVRAREGAPEYDAWRERHPPEDRLEDRPETWSDFLEDEQDAEVALRTAEVYDAIEQAQDVLD